MIEVGKKAPAISLPDAEGTKRTLKEFLGKKVVLYFYPKDNSKTCTLEAIYFTEKLKQFEKISYGIKRTTHPGNEGGHEGR